MTTHTQTIPATNYATLILTSLAVWFGIALSLALSGALNSAPGTVPMTMVAGILVPPALFGLAYRSSTGFRDYILSLDIRPLILLHTWRMLGLGFVFLYFYDVLPGWFALPAGLGDAAAAAGALFLGVALYSSKDVSRKKIWNWNTFGLLDFVIAVSTGFLTRPGMEIFSSTTTSAPMNEFPMALIPGFGVPFFIITHLIIYLKLHRAGDSIARQH